MYDIYDNDFDKAFDEAVDAIEKKEHRLIWADKLKQHYAWWGNDGAEYRERKADFDTIIDLQPTVDAEPTKHGRWEQYLNEGLKWKCSRCGSRFATPWHYCPNCGADMREVENG